MITTKSRNGLGLQVKAGKLHPALADSSRENQLAMKKFKCELEVTLKSQKSQHGTLQQM